jgi:hypothetical protein
MTQNLFKLSDLTGTYKKWDYSLPTLVNKNKNTIQITNIDQFKQQMYIQFPVLNDIDITDIMILGNFIPKILLNINNNLPIADMYVSNGEQNIIEKITKNIYNADNTLKITNNGRYLEFAHLKQKYILRLWFATVNSITTLIKSYDLLHNEVIFINDQLYFTQESLLCYQNMVILYLNQMSKKFEERLIEAFTMGFSIVMAGLDIDQLKTEYLEYGYDEICILQELSFSYSCISDKMIYTTNMKTHHSNIKTTNINMLQQVDNMNYHSLLQSLEQDKDFVIDIDPTKNFEDWQQFSFNVKNDLEKKSTISKLKLTGVRYNIKKLPQLHFIPNTWYNKLIQLKYLQPICVEKEQLNIPTIVDQVISKRKKLQNAMDS